MPFKSVRQMKYLFANKPKMANEWVKDAKTEGEPVVQKAIEKREKK